MSYQKGKKSSVHFVIIEFFESHHGQFFDTLTVVVSGYCIRLHSQSSCGTATLRLDDSCTSLIGFAETLSFVPSHFLEQLTADIATTTESSTMRGSFIV